MIDVMPMPPVLSAIHRHVAAAATGAAAATLGAAGILGLLRDSIAVPSGVLILVVFVVGSAAVGVRAVGLAAAVAAAVGFDYFLTAPYYTFNIDKADDLEVTVLLLVVGLIVNEIALWGRHEQARASRETGYLDGVLRATELA